VKGLLLDLPGDWRHQARCGDRRDDLFFPTGTTGPAEDQIREAKAICALCPVREDCLEWALDTGQDFGIWGGLTEEERRAIRRGRPMRMPRHGSAYRYDQGCRCKPCTSAKTAAVRKSRQRKARAS
jgi:WhiB family redox-sensing transcriptional regulator